MVGWVLAILLGWLAASVRTNSEKRILRLHSQVEFVGHLERDKWRKVK